MAWFLLMRHLPHFSMHPVAEMWCSVSCGQGAFFSLSSQLQRQMVAGVTGETISNPWGGYQRRSWKTEERVIFSCGWSSAVTQNKKIKGFSKVHSNELYLGEEIRYYSYPMFCWLGAWSQLHSRSYNDGKVVCLPCKIRRGLLATGTIQSPKGDGGNPGCR